MPQPWHAHVRGHTLGVIFLSDWFCNRLHKALLQFSAGFPIKPFSNILIVYEGDPSMISMNHRRGRRPDARTVSQYVAGHPKSALNVPIPSLDR